ncbi:hypothetical protein E0198_003422 [Clavispora lusitaniae]|nr:hypothetical protein E0198_003422 [Clavispora lusitaniae]
MTKCSECLVIGHRGFKAKYTENTIHGFEKCFETGATMFETDVWTTKDDVLVISHDVNTNRIFCDENGNETNYNILESYYDEIKDLRTIESGERMLTFKGLLRWFLEYVQSHGGDSISEHRIMLDIKNANPPRILQLIVAAIIDVHNDLAWWFSRIQFGIWHLRFIKYLNQDPYFQEVFAGVTSAQEYRHFDIIHISIDWHDSMTYMAYNEYIDSLQNDRFKFKITAISLIYITTWSTDFVTKFMPILKKEDLKLYSWTVNTLAQLEYFSRIAKSFQVREYGIITDSPDKMIDYLEDVEHEIAKESAETKPLIDPKQPNLPFKFKFSHFLFRGFLMWIGFKGMECSQKNFESTVDPTQLMIMPRKWFMKFFAYLQHRGIF